QCESEKGQRGCADHVVQLIEAIFLFIRRLVVPGSQPREAGGDERLRSGVGELVTGKLFEDEAIVRLVLIERTDDILAIAPHAWLDGVALVAISLGITGQVKPVPAPTFAITSTREKVPDNAVRGPGRSILQIGVLLGRSG